MITKQIIVKGIVQGVAFRQSTRKKAIDLKIQGTVENLPDRSVRIIATGTVTQLDAFVSWCWQGPSAAVVQSVEVADIPIQLFELFSIV